MPIGLIGYINGSPQCYVFCNVFYYLIGGYMSCELSNEIVHTGIERSSSRIHNFTESQ